MTAAMLKIRVRLLFFNNVIPNSSHLNPFLYNHSKSTLNTMKFLHCFPSLIFSSYKETKHCSQRKINHTKPNTYLTSSIASGPLKLKINIDEIWWNCFSWAWEAGHKSLLCRGMLGSVFIVPTATYGIDSFPMGR